MVQVVCFTRCKTLHAFILGYGNSNEQALLHLSLHLDGESGLCNNIHQHPANADRKANFGVVCTHFFHQY